MANNLPFEFTKYSKHRRYLKRTLGNTKSALQEITRIDYFTPEQLSDILLKPDEEANIKEIIENPIGIIILGAKSWAKATIVNELLGYALLPVNNSEESQTNNNWRTVRFMYGNQTQVSLAVANCYELVEHLAVYDRVWHQIPRSDLELKEPKEAEDPGYFSATLEIKLPHSLLSDDVQIIVAPSPGPYSTFESIYHTCFDSVSPVVIYALSDEDSLSSIEVDDLMKLRKLAPKLPVFFVRAQRGFNKPIVSPLNGDKTFFGDNRSSLNLNDISSASELTESQQHLLLNKASLISPIKTIQGSPPSSCVSPSPLSQSPYSQRVSRSNTPVPQNNPSVQTQIPSNLNFFQQLYSLGFLPQFKYPSTTEAESNQTPIMPSHFVSSRKSKQKKCQTTIEPQSELIENFENFSAILPFTRQVLQSHLVQASNLLHALHTRCLRMFILTAFDMTRDMMITPKRIDYAKQKEQQLFDSLMGIANKKQEEIRNLITSTVNSMRNDMLESAAQYKFKFNPSLNTEIDSITFGSGTHFYTSDSFKPSSPDLQMLTAPLSPISPGFRSPSRVSDSSTSSSTSSEIRITSRETQIAISEIQDFILGTLNAAIAGKLIGSVDYLRDSYIGTLERCLESLEKVSNDSTESVQASNAFKQILNAAYQVEINMRTTSSLLRVFWEKMKQLVVSTLPWKPQPIIDKDWKIKVASDVLDSLSESRLAKSICAQFKERLKLSHEQFSNAMKQLESVHSGRLEKTEEQRVRVRKVYAPKIARYALESTSLRDVIIHGMPQLGREIGRGQYGVVYACDLWANSSPVALKSVVPPDDKHWNDLAMEFYYTRSIPDHDRIVQIRGSVIDYSYGGGSTPAVLLIMDRLSKDLYSAIKNGVEWLSRLQIAIDVVQGIRFLHSQGLVHRDIKLKNVLLDKRNRAKITDLGFCKPEAMMSGSIVGTPIHMAPELFSGKYDNTVDVYAFGILFWYICAGHVRLPYIFEQCQNKDQLWNCVRKGARPERLPQFDDDCWSLMEQSWAGDPSQRPLLGDVEPRLISILERYKISQPPTGYSKNYMRNRLLHSYHHHHHHGNRHQTPATIK